MIHLQQLNSSKLSWSVEESFSGGDAHNKILLTVLVPSPGKLDE